MIRPLLAGAIDYAGLFPPAGRDMAAATAAYAEYRAGPDAWALGRFVVPAARLRELGDAAAPVLAAPLPWRLSVLVGPDLDADLAHLAALRGWGEGTLVADSLEARAATVDEVRALAERVPPGADVYVEIPVTDDPGRLLDAVADAGLRAKIRMGGVTAAQFPGAADVARFLAGCAARDLPFKATAGLHHPVRGDYPLTYEDRAPVGTMYGYLNVFAAAVAAREGASAAELAPILEVRDVAVLTDVLRHGDRVAAARRDFVLSFGSCSFDEPLADLRRLGLL